MERTLNERLEVLCNSQYWHWNPFTYEIFPANDHDPSSAVKEGELVKAYEKFPQWQKAIQYLMRNIKLRPSENCVPEEECIWNIDTYVAMALERLTGAEIYFVGLKGQCIGLLHYITPSRKEGYANSQHFTLC